MSETCPGCGGAKRAQVMCCDPCWDRIPAKLPIGTDGQLMTWRRRLAQARNSRSWTFVDRVLDAGRTWLQENREPAS